MSFFKPGELDEWWKKYWKDMPEFSQEDLSPCRTLLVHFYTKEDVQEFAKLLDQKITSKTKFIWFPTTGKANLKEMGWFDES